MIELFKMLLNNKSMIPEERSQEPSTPLKGRPEVDFLSRFFLPGHLILINKK